MLHFNGKPHIKIQPFYTNYRLSLLKYTNEGIVLELMCKTSLEIFAQLSCRDE